MVAIADVLETFPPEVPVDPRVVAESNERSGRVLIVLDDDPTGTQSVANLPVLTSWEVEDFVWALQLRIDDRPAPAIYVLTNTRSLHADEAAERNRQVVRSAIRAAKDAEVEVGFVSRGDSTLRGHYPLEPDVIDETLRAEGRRQTDGVIIVPAFPDAGRVTVGSEHYLRIGEALTKVSDTEFAADSTFGFSTSFLPEYVEEKSDGRIRASDVLRLDLDVVRSGEEAIADALRAARGGTPVVADVVTENDLRALSLGLARAEEEGKTFIYRVGPPFVRARVGQEPHPPLSAEEVYVDDSLRVSTVSDSGGLIVVGSHVGLTTRQLARLTAEHRHATVVELDVEQLLQGPPGEYIAATTNEVARALHHGDVILHTSRLLRRSDDAAESLRISRSVSAGLVAVVNGTLKRQPPRFVIAKGGITSSDVATFGLEIRRAMVRGPMLPGIVSLWEALEGPAAGIPYVVFAGNVGDDDSLLAVTRKLSAFLDD